MHCIINSNHHSYKCVFLPLSRWCFASIFADRDERNDRPTRQRDVQYINNTGGVVVIGQVVSNRKKYVGATSLNGDFAVRTL